MLTRNMIVGMTMATLFLVTTGAWGTTYYVDPNGSDDANGLSWDTAFVTIQKGIDSASNGDAVLVADGTYTGAGNRAIKFKGKAITVRSQNGPANCIVDCEQTAKGFMFDNNEDANSVLDGFTIKNTKTDGPDIGVAVWISSGSCPTITDCVITDNSHYVFRFGSTPSPTGSPSLSDCVIMGNSGWGIDCAYRSPSISRCIIVDNGGGIKNSYGSATVDNCLIKDNSGGGICYVNTDGNEWLVVTNCTIVGNDNGVYTTGVVTLTNSIFWDNFYWEIDVDNTGGIVDVNVEYCDVKGGQDGIRDPADRLNWGVGNIESDPNFALAGDYHLTSGSPCVDAGTNDPCGGLASTDLERNSRRLDGDNDGNDVADMGAYEYDDVNCCIAVSLMRMKFITPYRGWDPISKTLSIRNCGAGTLNWQVSEDCSWLEVSPSNGSSAGEVDELSVNVDVSGMGYGSYECTLTISDGNAINNPREVWVRLVIGEQEADDGSVIDIMLVWAKNKLVSQEEVAEMEEIGKAWVAGGTQVFENSLINSQLRFVHAGPVYNYGGGQPCYEAAARDDGYMDEVYILRDIYSADFVGVDRSGPIRPKNSDPLISDNYSYHSTTIKITGSV